MALVDEINNKWWIICFPLVGLKWYITGVLGRIPGQLVILIPAMVYVYFYILYLIKLSHFQKKPKYSSGNKYKKKYLPAAILITYIIFISFSIFRTIDTRNLSDILNPIGRIITLFTFTIISYISVMLFKRKNNQKLLWLTIIDGLGLYLLLNVVGRVFGIQNPLAENTQLQITDTLYGFNYRTIFPFSVNYQSIAIEAGLLIVLCSFAIASNQKKVRLYIYIATALAIIFLTNSRTPLWGVFIALLGLFLLHNNHKKMFYAMLFIIILMPLIFCFININYLFSIIDFDNFLIFTRSRNLQEFATLNNRVGIWKTVFNKFQNFELIHIIGYGAFGHNKSGLSDIYTIGTGWDDPSSITLHNAFLQHLIDNGYAGLLIMLTLILTCINLCVTSYVAGNVNFLIPMGTIMYLVGCSALDVTINFNQNITFILFITALIDVIQKNMAFEQNNFLFIHTRNNRTLKNYSLSPIQN